MTSDANKGITVIGYNHLNLPDEIVTGSGTISYVYDALGTKLQKSVSGEGSVTQYAGNFVYAGSTTVQTLQHFGHPEGYVTPDGMGGYDHVYQYRDHLGNVRLSYSDADLNGSINPSTEILQERNFYPFGLEHRGYNNVVNGTENNHFNFNGKELDESLRLNWLDFGARNYMPDIGRTPTLDPSAENYFSVSPYGFFANNPISFTDPTGADILFWRFNSDGDGGGEWEQVGYDQLDE